MPDIRVAWWNLENLFDHENATRPTELAKKLKKELVGWTVAVRNQKLDQLAGIIKTMFGGAGPDLLGVCEIENETVLQLLADRMQLAGRQYKVAAHASPDARGIDVSFIFDSNVLTAQDIHHQVVVKRTATRDLFWLDLIAKETGDVFVAMANHWPARSAGQYASEPFRMLTGETLSYALSQLFEAFDVAANIPILIMGDFNDEPFNRSMQEYLLGTRDPGRVKAAKSPIALNLMWPLMQGDDPGTYLYSSNWNMLDQFLVTKGMLRTQSPVKVDLSSIEIFRPAAIRKTNGSPKKFGRPSKASSFNQTGFSDHFPITVLLKVG